MKPKYKVGDQVLIKSKYDRNKTWRSYKVGFTQFMLTHYGGTIQTISAIKYHAGYGYYYYILKGIVFGWSDDMFDPTTDEL